MKSGPAADYAIATVVSWLTSFQIPFAHPHPRQLKIGAVNYYPTTGKITIDGARTCCPEHGLAGLVTVLGWDPAYARLLAKGSVVLLRPQP